MRHALLVAVTVTVTACTGGVVAADRTHGSYVNVVHTTSPCAMSRRALRLNHGYEDELCAAWIGPRGYVHIGPISDAPANANFVG